MEFLSLLHLENYYYGDLKPQNILVQSDYNDFRVKFGDFGGTVYLNINQNSYHIRCYTKKFC